MVESKKAKRDNRQKARKREDFMNDSACMCLFVFGGGGRSGNIHRVPYIYKSND